MTSIGNAPISKNEMEALITNHVNMFYERICFEYYMMIKKLTGNRLLIGIFGKLVYLSPVERYVRDMKCTCHARVCSPIYIFLCTVLLTL